MLHNQRAKEVGVPSCGTRGWPTLGHGSSPVPLVPKVPKGVPDPQKWNPQPLPLVPKGRSFDLRSQIRIAEGNKK
jgi:hypothetical protein